MRMNWGSQPLFPDYVLECILHDKQPGAIGAEELADVRAIEAVYESIQTGKLVRIAC